VSLRVPDGPGVRDDSGVYEGWEVSVHYDPLISKLIVWAGSRPEAIRRMRRALSEYRVLGIQTTLPFFQRALRHPAFERGDFDTSFVATLLEKEEEGPGSGPGTLEVAVAAAAIRELRERQAARLRPTGDGAPRSRWWEAGVRQAHGRRG
jgi:acetyl-CoA carboxylase biotin carboxylase subunit